MSFGLLAKGLVLSFLKQPDSKRSGRNDTALQPSGDFKDEAQGVGGSWTDFVKFKCFLASQKFYIPCCSYLCPKK